jgi:hypothetical protein
LRSLKTMCHSLPWRTSRANYVAVIIQFISITVTFPLDIDVQICQSGHSLIWAMTLIYDRSYMELHSQKDRIKAVRLCRPEKRAICHVKRYICCEIEWHCQTGCRRCGRGKCDHKATKRKEQTLLGIRERGAKSARI